MRKFIDNLSNVLQSELFLHECYGFWVFESAYSILIRSTNERGSIFKQHISDDNNIRCNRISYMKQALHIVISPTHSLTDRPLAHSAAT